MNRPAPRAGLTLPALTAALAVSLFLPGGTSLASRAGLATAHLAHSAATPRSAYSDGTRYLTDHRYAQAVTAFKAAIKQHDHVAAAYAGLGAAYIYLLRYPEAFDAYKHAAGIQPGNANDQYQAAWSALYSRKTPLQTYAVAYATNYIQLRPKDVRGYIIRFLGEGNLLEAKAQLTDAKAILRLRPHSADSYNYLGIAYANLRKLAQAATEFSTAIRLSPSNPQFFLNRAEIELVQKHYTKTMADYRKALALTPKTDLAVRAQIDGLIKALQKKMHG